MEKDNTISQEKENKSPKVKRKLLGNVYIPTLDDIKRLALLRFGSYSEIARAFGGYTKGYAFRVLNGQQIIKKDKTIQKIADALGVPFEVLYKVLPKGIKS